MAAAGDRQFLVSLPYDTPPLRRGTPVELSDKGLTTSVVTKAVSRLRDDRQVVRVHVLVVVVALPPRCLAIPAGFRRPASVLTR